MWLASAIVGTFWFVGSFLLCGNTSVHIVISMFLRCVPYGKGNPILVRISIADHSPDRRGEHPQQHLAHFAGVLQANSFAGYAELYLDGRVQEAACMAHARRIIHDLHTVRPNAVTEEVLRRIDALYNIEEQIRGKPPDEQHSAHQTQAVPMLDDIKFWFEATFATLSAKSDATKAIRYALNRWPALV
ncbi:putative transposase [Burkholderia lata]|uniref:Putative transposase n=1 Tax=Burkholderia lata (strain ATCC 17760 / DSM 23089 / LMG 22485 / NCIMB 9086 / R18194 / 383) TaxID=482957 RepID=A0A6P2NTL1_BURL3|nr:putative transposase [Burkholderia lata]